MVVTGGPEFWSLDTSASRSMRNAPESHGTYILPSQNEMPQRFGHLMKIHPGTNCRQGHGEREQQLGNVSAALIRTSATLVFEGIQSLHKSKASSGTLKKKI